MALYTIIAETKPNRYVEVGYGNSTLVAHKAIQDNDLDTRIISIDPFPRAEIDSLALPTTVQLCRLACEPQRVSAMTNITATIPRIRTARGNGASFVLTAALSEEVLFTASATSAIALPQCQSNHQLHPLATLQIAASR